ncbi:MAG TPA: peptidoglycan DD-metalloendopeptidase family protein [Steroidobacteraceae bacterium]|nr:peptidoglycan DD-metalloendopeptidase family protein [Steroidobacteraceae bacterium]
MTPAVHIRFAFALLACVLVLASCGEPYRKPPPPTYTVKAGDTVYSIAWRHHLDYRVLARWNNLPADYRIEIGQVLRLRAPTGKAVRTASTPPPPVARTPSRPPIDPSIAAWMWPADGSSNIVRHAPTSSQGLLISGTEGAPVRAAAAGRVVYTGSGLRGFGNLLIIKHSNLFLSAYGHNQSLSVKEGDQVALGQTVASMGLGPGQKPALYFEIRYNGQPVDPLAYLPQR